VYRSAATDFQPAAQQRQPEQTEQRADARPAQRQGAAQAWAHAAALWAPPVPPQPSHAVLELALAPWAIRPF
jgi:hypothetical protein